MLPRQDKIQADFKKIVLDFIFRDEDAIHG
jgi:hypothetical protein